MTYDTDESIQEMKAAGIPEEHARAITQSRKKMMANEVATRFDLVTLKGDFEKEMSALRLDLEKRFADLSSSMTYHFIGTVIALAGLIVAMHTVFA